MVFLKNRVSLLSERGYYGKNMVSRRVDHYHCLMPVEYEAVEENGVVQEYKKSKMVCRHSLSGQCEQKEDCTFFKDAPEILEKNANWYEP